MDKYTKVNIPHDFIRVKIRGKARNAAKKSK